MVQEEFNGSLCIATLGKLTNWELPETLKLTPKIEGTQKNKDL